MVYFNYNDKFSSHSWIFITIMRFISSMNFHCSDEFWLIWKFSLMNLLNINFIIPFSTFIFKTAIFIIHQWIVVTAIFFHPYWCCSSISFHYINKFAYHDDECLLQREFSLWLGIFIVMMNLFDGNEFSSKWWIFIIVMNGYHSDECSWLWCTFNLVMNFHHGYKFSSYRWILSQCRFSS